ncbi:MAG: Triosephosphate isomerase [Pseudolabrys sp.]|jgi:triosephosphate isomerase|nr:Triosephosphate isomerase [Pseudolabrys sp.]
MATPTPRPLVAGNWKMHGLKASAAEFGRITQGATALWPHTDLMICPPATLLVTFAVVALGSKIQVGAQDCHARPSGAFTGDISAEMLADAGATAVIVGHSERRTLHHETDADVRAKAEAAWRAGLTAIVCVGETAAERTAGQALSVVVRQLSGSVPDGVAADRLVMAYEPVWAIGTGLTPTADDIAEVHKAIRKSLIERFGSAAAGVRILYGGSVKPSNAAEILKVPDVNGALIGGASLKADDFLGIARAYVPV